MTVIDLLERGFHRHPTLPRAYTYCSICRVYHWHSWWLMADPNIKGIHIAACDACGTLPPFEAALLRRFPIVQELPVLVKK